MRKLRFALAVALCAVAGSAGTQGAVAAAWAPTATKALVLTHGALGRAPASQTLRVGVSLAMRDRGEALRTIEAVSNPSSSRYGRFLTPAQVLQRFGPTAASVGAVTAYLRASGFHDLYVHPNRLLVDATGTVAQAEKAFNTRIQRYSYEGGVVYANASPAQVPASLSGVVTAVLGLSNIPMNRPSVHAPSAPVPSMPDFSGFGPRAILHAYDAESLKPASDLSIGVVAMGDVTQTIAHLRQAEKAEKLPVVPVEVVYGGQKDSITDDNAMTGSLEWDLDMQISTEMAGAVKKLYVYDVATYTDPDVARAINMFVAHGKAIALSASLGECEFIAYLDGAEDTTDQSLMEGALQGQSMFASTGDNGFACPEIASTGVPGGLPDISWPAAGEYTTAVGGTTLLADDAGNVQQEIAWIGGGGGVSPFETAAPWTLRANPFGQAWLYLNQGGRGIPDISTVADPFTGVLVYDGSSSPTVVGGTSVSSPLMMGLWARLQHMRHGKLGLAQYAIYRHYNKTNPGTAPEVLFPIYTPAAPAKTVPGFRDIVAGTNGLWFATPGWDYTTGVGVPDLKGLLQAL